MRNISKLFFALCLLQVAASASAFDYKRWYCEFCGFYPIGSPQGAQTPGEVYTFIVSNNDIILRTGPTWATTKSWVPNDLITVCDGTLCMKFFYHAAGKWLPTTGTFPDNGRGYKNAGIGRINGSPNSYFVARTDFDPSLAAPYLVTKHYTITMCVDGGQCLTVEGIANYTRQDFGANYDWSGDVNSSVAGGTDYTQTAGYNSHGTLVGSYYGGVGVMNGTAYGNSGLAPGDTVNVGNGGGSPIPPVRVVNK